MVKCVLLIAALIGVLFATEFFGLSHFGVTRKVAAQMYDPSAAKFRKIVNGDDYVCGEVNSKNLYGAYVGFRRFFVDGDGTVVVDNGDSSVAIFFNTFCKGDTK